MKYKAEGFRQFASVSWMKLGYLKMELLDVHGKILIRKVYKRRQKWVVQGISYYMQAAQLDSFLEQNK
ncbi:hypothetical protein NQ315_011633 [Exocentrus adspersus]|uniref:Uncharacterized protein n=1 Tax=Exocentrus adspersus TaxID=1586481 RepID=A0AAV8V8X8_9CUCU|nr:hypothetical protein NQ315_011633 [Exocentrus adspersus]